MVTVTYRIDEELQAALDDFCARHGLKQQAVVSDAIASWLEDAQDLALIEERRDGTWLEWDQVKDEL